MGTAPRKTSDRVAWMRKAQTSARISMTGQRTAMRMIIM